MIVAGGPGIALTDISLYSLISRAYNLRMNAKIQQQAIALRGQDSEMEFAAAIITEDSPAKVHREHFQKAVNGAKDGSLLAKNLVTHFGERGATIADLRTKAAVPSR